MRLVSVVTSTRSLRSTRVWISPMRSSIWPAVGRTEMVGSTTPVGRISCSTTRSLFSSSYGPGVFLGSAAYGTARPDVGALFGSDVSHWDVPDMTEPVAEEFELVEDGVITEGTSANAHIIDARGVLGTILASDQQLASPAVAAWPAFHVLWAAFAAEAIGAIVEVLGPAPVTMVAEANMLLVAHPSLGVTTYRDFLALARAGATGQAARGPQLTAAGSAGASS